MVSTFPKSHSDLADTWEATYQAVRAALAAGYRHIDTAGLSNEASVGQAIRDSAFHVSKSVTTKLPAETKSIKVH